MACFADDRLYSADGSVFDWTFQSPNGHPEVLATQKMISLASAVCSHGLCLFHITSDVNFGEKGD